MRYIPNPERDNTEYNCYGCAPHNPRGLKMEFHEDGNDIVCQWQPHADFQSYNNVLHGGVQAALFDELACWILMVKAGSAGLTQKLEISYQCPVFLTNGTITLRGRIESRHEHRVSVTAELTDQEGHLRSSAKAEFLLYPEKMARKRLHYPGHEKFSE
ncbi:MAG: PaaI family thioesterase [Bacteroidales bacterium]|nr:PaaI family thioesterase [Bacteroidales bacterium]MDD3663868.1 PaaI family thioesterase [Bacteroidales bacterium]